MPARETFHRTLIELYGSEDRVAEVAQKAEELLRRCGEPPELGLLTPQEQALLDGWRQAMAVAHSEALTGDLAVAFEFAAADLKIAQAARAAGAGHVAPLGASSGSKH